MATNTYVALDKVTVSGSSTTSISFASIPAGYTDLVIVEQSSGSVAAYSSLYFNGNNTGTNYSWTYVFGTGGSAVSGRVANNSKFEISYHSTSATPNAHIYHIMNYANATTFKTLLLRYNVTNDGTGAYVGLWRKAPEAITSITFDNQSGNYTAGSTFSLYGIASQEAAAKATGGMVTSDANYYYHTFLSSGTFTPKQSLSCDYLVIAGGGGGGSYAGGGGGAGGYLTNTTSVTATAYTVTIGAGGNGGAFSSGSAGSNSVFGAVTATGGGFGGGSSFSTAGGAGGSGGGSTGANGTTNAGGAASQGFAGGGASSGGITAGAGGGGAGAVGGSTTGPVGGAGGVGLNALSTWATATSTGVSGYYAGGGGGGADTASGQTVGAGGLGGGGAGALTAPVAGTANSGGGGGGVWNPSFTGGAGGSGIVIVRYAK